MSRRKNRSGSFNVQQKKTEELLETKISRLPSAETHLLNNKVLRTSFILHNQKISSPNSPLKIYNENILSHHKNPSLTGHSMTKSEKNSKIFIFGGKNQDLGNSNKTWIYDVQKKSFFDSYPNVKSSLPNLLSFKKLPASRYGHTFSTLQDDTLILFGGMEEKFFKSNPFNDLWIFSILPGDKYKWYQPQIESGQKPKPRFYHSASVYESNKLIIFGGNQSMNKYLNDVWMLEYKKKRKDKYSIHYFEWSCLHEGSISGKSKFEELQQTIEGEENLVPKKRAEHASAIVDSKLYVFGGNCGSKVLNDLWYFDLEKQKWKQISTNKNSPTARYGHSMCSIGNFIFILFGIGNNTKYENNFSMDNIYSFDTYDEVWNHVEDIDDSLILVGACSLVHEIDRILIYGGSQYNTIDDEYVNMSIMWIFDSNLVKGKKIKKKKQFIRDYEIIKRLGNGSQGVVHLVKKNDEYFAIKIIELYNFLSQDEFDEDFFDGKSEEEILKILNFKELNIYEKLNHKNILELKEHFIRKKNDSIELCFLFSYCDLGDLSKFIKIKEISEIQIIEISIEILEGLSYCHSKKIIHRDLKPENIFLVKKNDNEFSIKIGDFGFSKNLETTIAKSLVGTIKFMAPELFEKTEYDYSIDIWSFGIVFYLLLTRYKSLELELESKNFYDFKIEENRLLIPKILSSTEFKFKNEYIKIIESCIEKEPSERIASENLLQKFQKLKRKYENEEEITPLSSSSSNSTSFTQNSTSIYSSMENNTPIPLNEKLNDLKSFLKEIGMSEYEKNFIENGYDDFEFLREYGLTNQNLEEIGIELPGHRRKLKIKLEELK
eukprot:gene6925-11088_t